MSRRRSPPVSVLLAAPLLLSGCFNPDDPPSSGATETDATETGIGTGPGSTSGSSTAGTPTTGSGVSTAVDTSCEDECVGAPMCDGDILQVCVVQEEGCNVIEPFQCPEGCAVGECIGTVCGDENLEEPEECDDGNAEDGDGCSSQCAVEAGWTCTGPSNGTCSAPNLAIRILGAASNAQGLQVTYDVQNSGGVASGAYRVDLWDTRAGGLDNPPELGDVGAITISDKPSLAPGETDLFTDTVPVPANGTHFAFAVVDTRDELFELDDNDNVALGSAWTNAGSVIHASFTATGTPSPIPSDGTPGSASVTVSSAASSTPELFFSINISHSNIAELSARVLSPSGGTRLLFSGLTEGENLRSTSIREGGAEISGSGAPHAGTFEFAADWDQAPLEDGDWTLEVVDQGGEATGRINAFSVHTFLIE